MAQIFTKNYIVQVYEKPGCPIDINVVERETHIEHKLSI
jgi:hypothetical protein